MGFLGGSDSKAPACIVGDQDLIPGLGRSTGEGKGNTCPLEEEILYSHLENSMHGGASGLQSKGSQRVTKD